MASLMTHPRIPLLSAGDVLTRDEFERRYAAMPDVKKAELIEGIVYMGSPVRHSVHGHPEFLLSNWLGAYVARTPGLDAGHNSTLRLDLDNEPQPDLLLRMPVGAGGACRSTADGYLEGPPELVVEVAASTVSMDLHQKLRAYRRNGVREYLVFRVEDGAVDWFELQRGAYVPIAPDTNGCVHSRVFPGLCLDVGALLRADIVALQDAVARNVGSPAHRAFVARIAPAG